MHLSKFCLSVITVLLLCKSCVNYNKYTFYFAGVTTINGTTKVGVNFEFIAKRQIKTAKFTLKLKGRASVVIGLFGAKAIDCSGRTGVVTIEPLDPDNDCTLNPLVCATTGVTLGLTLKITKLVEGGVLFSSGADNFDSPGICVRWIMGRFVATVRTQTEEWNVVFSGVSIKAWARWEVSWSKTTGLAVHINNRLVAYTKVSVKRTIRVVTKTTKLTIGGASTGEGFGMGLILANFDQFSSSDRTTLVANGLLEAGV